MNQGLKRASIALAVLAIFVTVGLAAYARYLRKVRIAFVGFSDSAWAAYEEAGRATPYTLHRLEREDIVSAPLETYNAVFLWGMGLNLDNEQTAALQDARDHGAGTMVISATSDLSRQQTSLSEEQQSSIVAYVKHGGPSNLTAMLHYVARELAGREVPVSPLEEKPQSGLFHLGDTLFETLDEFEAYLAANRPQLPDDAPKVALIGAFLNPGNKFDRPHLDYFIERFEHQGVRVYPIFGARESIDILELVKPDLAIVFPHGRIAPGNRVPELLAAMNIPCLSALSITESYEDWMADERGMSGGILGQSIIMPELDGVIEPIAVAAQRPDERGIRVRTPIEDRIDRFATRATNWLMLQRKPNAEKRVAIVYYKAPGMSALSASGLETVPSLWNLLKRMEEEGYDLGGQLPETPDALFELIQAKGKTLGQWAIGSYEKFLDEAEPEFIPAESYAEWFTAALSEKRQRECIELWGPIPGKQMVAQRDGRPHLVVSRIKLGNVVIMPQPTVGGGGEDEDEVKSIHGTDQAPPHFYLGAYLWAQHGYQADAIVHFGTHGSLEFTYGKSTCLSRDCWPDILIGDLPHVYPYIINNVGEGMIAKRRSYAVLISHLTPPFTESGLYGDLSLLHEKLHTFEGTDDPLLKRETRDTLTRMVRELNLDRDAGLRADDLADRQLDDEEINRIHDLIHQISERAITDGLHVLGRPLSDEQRRNTVVMMLGQKSYDIVSEVTGHSGDPELVEDPYALVRPLVAGVMSGETRAEQFFSEDEPAADPKLRAAFLNVLDDIQRYAGGLRESPELELTQTIRALAGGFVLPSPGGDPLFNPESVPTGRNLYSINAEATPSEEAWRVGKLLAGQIIERHRVEAGHYPQQVAFTLWGGEFIRGKGTTLAEIMYLIGVRPLYNSRGTVYDVELIPAEELGRPRIDVLVQTSGQFRDAAASRIELLDKAITMVAGLPDESVPNYVRDGAAATEQDLKKLGFSPKEARELSTARIFGSAANQSYGTGIMGLVEKGDQWEDESQVANRYMRNMGGAYRNGQTWGTFREGVLGAAMQGTEIVVQPRSSNTWGPMSLDHVYEFMGGMTLSIRNKTGHDPAGYFSDLRTRGRPHVTMSVAAIREEARTTLWNPKFILGMQSEGASAAGSLTETVRNMYGWNVMQPSAIDQEMWDETYRVYIEDKHDLEMRQYFEEKNPYALQDMTAVMLETARKGYWQPSEDVLQKLAQVHAELVAKFGAACSYETCGNAKLREFLNGRLVAPGNEVASDVVDAYGASLAAVHQSSQPIPEVEGLELEEKTELAEQIERAPSSRQTVALAGFLVLFVVGMLCVGAGNRGPVRRTDA
jgi:cobaltochelatase CobN